MLTYKARTIHYYRTPSNRSPVEEFLDALQDRDARKVAWVLRIVERTPIVPQQYFKKIAGANDLWEIRAQFGSNTFRLFGFFDGPTLLILTNGFSKKQQRIQRREIELAEARRNDYLEGKNHS